jgi:hypothetical protein
MMRESLTSASFLATGLNCTVWPTDPKTGKPDGRTCSAAQNMSPSRGASVVASPAQTFMSRLATLHAHGLLRGGFVPPADIRRLQDYQRLRAYDQNPARLPDDLGSGVSQGR